MDRRKFLHDAALGTIGFSLLNHNSRCSRIKTSPKPGLGIALVGLGYYSTELLAPALQLTQNCYLAGIVTGSPEKAAYWQKQYAIPEKNIYNYENFDKIADNAEIDVIYIVLPNSLHAEYVVKAAQAGKHVWCEKPMAVSVAECEQMIAACEKNKVHLSIGYRMHHEPNTRTIMDFAKTKPYGNIQKLSASSGYFDNRTDHWKFKKAMGGGATYDMGVYCINAARYVTGQEPVSVLATQSTNRPRIYTEVDETMHFELEFPGGARAVCETSFGKNMNSLQVDCANGWYKLEPFQSYSGVNGVTSDGRLLNATINNEQTRQMDDDAMAIMPRKKGLVSGMEGLMDVGVVEAIYRSVKEGKRVGI
jgi:glucose-fructose oxidoreductase